MFESVLHQSLGGGVTPFSGLYAKALPNRGAFLCLQYTKGRRNLLFQYFKGLPNYTHMATTCTFGTNHNIRISMKAWSLQVTESLQ